MKKTLTILTLLLTISCAQEVVVVQELPKITAETQTEIEIWSWDVAAKSLEEVAKNFNKKYPNIKVNVVEFGDEDPLVQKAGIVLSSGKGMPDVFTAGYSKVPSYAEQFPHRILDLKEYIDPNWTNEVSPSKVSTSFDTEGRLVSIPWDLGPVVLFYRADLFEQAGVDINSIVTWEDYITQGKKFQSAIPKTKWMGVSFTGGAPLWHIVLQENKSSYLNKKGEIIVNNKASFDSLTVLKRILNAELTFNNVNWDGQIRASKSGDIATLLHGGWWGGTLKDQMPEMAGKWKIARMPSFSPEGAHAANQGGSTLMVSASDPVKQAASVAFVKFALLTPESGVLMYETYGLIPAYLLSYEDPIFSKIDPYFNQTIGTIFGDTIAAIPDVEFPTSDSYGSATAGAYETVFTGPEDIDIQAVLDNAAEQIKNITGRTIAE